MGTHFHEYTSATGARALVARAALTLAAMALGLSLMAPELAQAQTYRVIYTFTGGADGANPYAPLIRDSAGNLYGTTNLGGTFNAGTVFKVNKAGQETVLYTFTGGTDGLNPFSGLVQDAAGNLYGTTALGGAAGLGTVFEVSRIGMETVLHSFTLSPDGDIPYSGLIRDAGGNLYGTTENGGKGEGTVFKVDPSGAETILHSFGAVPDDGGYPFYAGVVRDAEGNLYGTTGEGGANRFGTVFKLPRGGKETVLYSFPGYPMDGAVPYSALAIDAAGNLYGTTGHGGAYALGTVFKIDTTGKETVLHSFAGYPTDGEIPYSALAIDAAGNLYGTAAYGGSDESCHTAGIYGCGIVFKLDTTGKETILHSFTAGPAGGYPIGGLLLDSAGNLWGTTEQGGDFAGCVGGCGIVFEVTP